MKIIKWFIPIIAILFIMYISRTFKLTQNITLEDTSYLEQEQSQINQIFNNLTLDEKIGQLLVLSNRTSKMTEDLKSTLIKLKPGGFILFKENISNYEDTSNLIKEIKNTNEIPMLISIDQEGGKVQRLTEIPNYEISKIPSNKSIGDTKDEKLAYDIGAIIAEELQVFGINVDFAPVIDVVDNEKNQVIGDRSFGSDASLVSRMGVSLAKGLEEHGVIPVYKHFPGHGSTEVDSHYDLPVLNKTKEELYQNELIPFQEAIKNNAEMIMIGHLAVPNISNDNTPASLSKEIIQNLLKEELQYKGLIITDALNMKAITDNYSEKEIYEKALNAGVDLLLMPINPEKAIEYIKELIREQKVKEEQIDISVKKILSLKYQKMSTKINPVENLGSQEHQAVLSKINKSLTKK